MSNPVPSPTSPNDSATPPSAPAGSVPPTPEPWKVPETADPAFRGKTPEQLLADAQQMYGALTQLAQQRQTYQPPPAPVQPQGNVDWNAIADSDFVDGRTMKQGLAQAAQAVVGHQNQAQQRMSSMLAESNLDRVRDKHGLAFQKYGPEIMAHLASIPHDQWTLALLEGVVKIVRSDHLEDLASERARELVTQMDPSLRPTGAHGDFKDFRSAPTGRIIESDRLSPEYQAQLKRTGLTDADVRQFCEANGMTTDQWMDMAAKHKTSVITERSNSRDGRTETPSR